MADFAYLPMFDAPHEDTPWRKLDGDYVAVDTFRGEEVVVIQPGALADLTREAFKDISFFLRPGHLAQLRSILDDPEASENDRFVALDLLKNANIAAGGVLPMCQDTGTAIIMAKKGDRVWTSGSDEEELSRGVFRTYDQENLRFSQLSPISMFEEKNTGSNLPVQLDMMQKAGGEYEFLFMAKGGGSANKAFLYQATPSQLHPERLVKFLDEKIRTLGTAACPPYHLAIVIGGTSAEMNLKTVKLASARYYDHLPTKGGLHGQAIRDVEMEQQILHMTQQMGIGAQFGGKYFCHDIRVIRLPRHGASLPIGLGVSCSADRQALGKITRDGVFVEQLEMNPAQYLPEIDQQELGGDVVSIDLNQPMQQILKQLTAHPIKTRLALSGPMIVARDLAHARIQQEMADGKPMPDYFKNHPIYYAGPAKRPEGYASGSFGPTTAGRMDSFVDEFQGKGGSMVMLAKGNRSRQVVDACAKNHGFYLGSIGGSAARLAQDHIRKVECLDFEEFGMEAVWRIEVENFPAFIVTDDKGNDFFGT